MAAELVFAGHLVAVLGDQAADLEVVDSIVAAAVEISVGWAVAAAVLEGQLAEQSAGCLAARQCHWEGGYQPWELGPTSAQKPREEVQVAAEVPTKQVSHTV